MRNIWLSLNSERNLLLPLPSTDDPSELSDDLRKSGNNNNNNNNHSNMYGAKAYDRYIRRRKHHICIAYEATYTYTRPSIPTWMIALCLSNVYIARTVDDASFSAPGLAPLSTRDRQSREIPFQPRVAPPQKKRKT